MKKKIILLIGLVFLLCGCTAEVDIDINGNTIKESVSIEAFANEYLTKDQLKNTFRTYVPAFAKDPIVDTMPDSEVKGISYYDRTLKDLGTGYRFNYKYNFNLNNYKNSRTVKEGFKSSSFIIDNKDKTILFSTDSGGLMYFNQYPDLSQVKVNITSSYEVKDCNADYKNGNVYTWIFNKGENKNIYLLLDNDLEKEESPSKEEGDKQTSIKKEEKEEECVFVKFLNEHPFLIVVLSLLLFIIIVLIVSKLTKIKYR